MTTLTADSTTLHSFPAATGLRSGRAWVIVAIVIVHAAFFWALTHGLSRELILFVPKTTLVELLTEEEAVLPPPPALPDNFVPQTVVIPSDQPIVSFAESDTALTVPATVPAEPVPTETSRPVPVPVIVAPQIDPARGYTTPSYPAAEIRAGHTGTVMLQVEVQANGRVGDVRVERSSGYPRLDEAAVAEARTWRFIPGTRDGVATGMWKQLPVTFRLDN